MTDRTRDRRSRHWFWLDNRIVDEFAPVMGHYPMGTAALAVYAVLARRADRDGDSWPSLSTIAAEAGISARTVQRALRLLEVLELVEIAMCYDQVSQRQTSNLYTLLPLPDPIPDIDPDPDKWDPPRRRTLLVRGVNRAEVISAARLEQRSLSGERPKWAGLVPADASAIELPPVTVSPSPPSPCHPPHDTVTPSPTTRCHP